MKVTNKYPIIFWIYLIFFAMYFSILWRNQIIKTDNGWMAGSDRTWADGAAHLSYISSFVERGFFLSDHPVYKGMVFSYPPAADWLSAILVICGLPLSTSFELVGFLLSMATIYALYIFYFEVFGRKSVTAVVSSLLFLWSGGLGFLFHLVNYLTANSLGDLPVRMTEMTDFGIRFINTIDAELLPQRSFLLGLPIGIFIILVWWKMVLKKRVSNNHLLLAGLLTGLLPIIHPHTFISIAVVVAFFVSYLVFYKKISFKKFWWYLVPAGSLGLILGLYQTRGIGSGFFWYKLGWLSSDMKVNWIWFWFLNWGVWFLLAILATNKSFKKYWLFLAPFLVLFVIANVIIFQPYDWDNSKIFTWVHLGFSGVIGYWLTSIWHKKSLWAKLAIQILFIASIASGLFDSMRLVDIKNVSIHFFSNEELQISQWIRENTNKNSIFLTSDTHRHYVPVLTGRQILMGYRGWLWSYGINYSQRERDVLEIYSGTENSMSLINKYGVDYVAVGPAEKDDFYRANVEWFEKNLDVKYESKSIKIYGIKTP